MAADAAQVVALDAAKMAADAAQVVALDAAKMAADAAQVVALDAAKTAADAAQVVALDAAKVIADAALKVVQDELDGLKIDTADTMAAAALVGKIARAGEVHTAIGVDPGGIVPKGTTDKTDKDGGDVGAVTAKRNAAGMVTVDVNGDADDDYAGGETNADSSAWNSVTMTKTNANDSTDMVVIYTDIEAPSDKKFSVAYNDTVLGDALLDATVGKVMSAGFPSEAGTTWDYTGADGERAKTVTGTFDGVPGDFTCTEESCSVVTDGMGKLMGAAGWRFAADAQNTATVKEPDAAYAYFGWWLNKPEEADSPHMVEVFAGGAGEGSAEATIDSDIEGTARYMGPAAGKYATKTFTAGVQTDAAVGHFTATTNLTAKFGDEAGISGTVTGFELDDTNAVPWKVNLELATFDNTADFTGTTEVNFGGGATDDDDGGAGAWQGTFYGAGEEPADAPSTVVGTFGAATDNASLLGAFGATKQ